jgi:hypothetical protein
MSQPDSQESAVESEVACLRFGDLSVACIPGELYPELVYGKFQEPVEPNVESPPPKRAASLLK